MKRILLLFFALGFIACLAQAQTTPKIYSRWSGRVIICSDPQSIYKSYQWYADSLSAVGIDLTKAKPTQFGPIKGATSQYYSKNGQGLYGYYYVVAKLADGTSVTSDTIALHVSQSSSKVSIAPNPVSKSSALNVETISPDIQLAKVQIYTMSGIMVRQYTTTDASAAIEAPSATGCYMVRIQLADGSTSTQKLFVK
ncbi:MAG: T9SS type A sorting domain-containing protein [Bacteroidota bacterium]|jgi:hypothetical protein|nr:T9SS type A sorting domain-containing protein [Bacteroidota bacterium]